MGAFLLLLFCHFFDDRLLFPKEELSAKGGMPCSRFFQLFDDYLFLSFLVSTLLFLVASPAGESYSIPLPLCLCVLLGSLSDPLHAPTLSSTFHTVQIAPTAVTTPDIT
jgi:hypothetical protein